MPAMPKDVPVSINQSLREAFAVTGRDLPAPTMTMSAVSTFVAVSVAVSVAISVGKALRGEK